MANPFQDSSYDVNPFDDGEGEGESGIVNVNPFADSAAPETRSPPGVSEYNPYNIGEDDEFNPRAETKRSPIHDVDLDGSGPGMGTEALAAAAPHVSEGKAFGDDEILPPLKKPDEGGLPPMPDYEDPNVFGEIEAGDSLARRETEVARKEKALEDIADKIDYRKKNWPVCFPIVYHSIRKDVAGIATSWMVRVGFIKWHAMAVVFFFNFCALFARMIIDFNANTIKSVVLSIVFGTLGFPIGFVLWYFPMYTAARKGRASGYVVFWLLFAVHVIYLLFCCCGIPGLGTCGIYNIIVTYIQHDVEKDKRTDSTKNSHIIVGSMMLVVFLCWLSMICWALLLYGWSVFAFLRRSTKGRSFKEELFGSEAVDNIKKKAAETSSQAASYAGQKVAESAAEHVKKEIDNRKNSYFGTGGDGEGGEEGGEVLPEM